MRYRKSLIWRTLEQFCMRCISEGTSKRQWWLRIFRVNGIQIAYKLTIDVRVVQTGKQRWSWLQEWKTDRHGGCPQQLSGWADIHEGYCFTNSSALLVTNARLAVVFSYSNSWFSCESFIQGFKTVCFFLDNAMPLCISAKENFYYSTNSITFLCRSWAWWKRSAILLYLQLNQIQLREWLFRLKIGVSDLQRQ